jgi:hypothetical protein
MKHTQVKVFYTNSTKNRHGVETEVNLFLQKIPTEDVIDVKLSFEEGIFDVLVIYKK